MEQKNWNYDRAVTVLAMLHHVTDDLMRVVHKGSPSQNVIDRMSFLLRSCADDVEKMKT
jgi:hypothetical protein